ncbi:putative membrane lipoprotein [Trifolium repens]|nr:putative membrane lipoprotein [Trifolium repens]
MEQSNYSKGVFYWSCWKKSSCSLHANDTTNCVIREIETTNHEQDLELGVDGKDMLLKSNGEESLELELMRLHNLPGPPRFLFTITEETREDLESEDGKSKCGRSRKGSRTKSLSDFIDSPMKCSSLDPLESYKHQGFNPLFESTAESEFNRFRSSPPPKFKFLRDAEEKLYRRLMEESRRKTLEENHHDSVPESEVKSSTNVTKVTESKKVPSSSSQVLPLTSSPTTFKPFENSSL